MAAGLPHAQAAQLDVVAEVADRRVRAGVRLGRRGVHQHARVLEISRAAAAKMIAATSSAAIASPCWKPGADRDEAGEHGERAGHVPGEMKGVGAQRGGLVHACAPRSETSDAADVHRERDRDHREHVPVRSNGSPPPVSRPIASTTTTMPPPARIAASPSAREVLGSPVPVGMVRVGRPAAEADREQRQHRRHDVAAGLDPGGHQTEAAGHQARPQLQDHQRTGREHGHQRRAKLTPGVELIGSSVALGYLRFGTGSHVLKVGASARLAHTVVGPPVIVAVANAPCTGGRRLSELVRGRYMQVAAPIGLQPPPSTQLSPSLRPGRRAQKQNTRSAASCAGTLIRQPFAQTRFPAARSIRASPTPDPQSAACGALPSGGCCSTSTEAATCPRSARSRSERLGEPRRDFAFFGSRQREPCIHENALLQVGDILDDRSDDGVDPAQGPRSPSASALLC